MLVETRSILAVPFSLPAFRPHLRHFKRRGEPRGQGHGLPQRLPRPHKRFLCALARQRPRDHPRVALLSPPHPQLHGRQAPRAEHGDGRDHADDQRARRGDHLAGAVGGRRAAGDVEQGREGEGVRRHDAGGADGVHDGPRAEQRGAVADPRAFGGGGRRGGARCDDDALGEDGGERASEDGVKSRVCSLISRRARRSDA